MDLAGQALGVNGAALFFEDLFRSEPFDHASTVPDATAAGVPPSVSTKEWKAIADAAAEIPACVRQVTTGGGYNTQRAAPSPAGPISRT